MTLFLLTFFLVYSGVNFYAFMRFRSAFVPGPAVTTFLILFLVLMVAAPIMVRLLEREELETAARFMAYTGYLWMGLLFSFFCASLAMDLYRLVIYILGHLLHLDLRQFSVSGRSTFLTAVVYSVCIAVYGYFEARNIVTEHVVIRSPKIPAHPGVVRLVQISDVHVGLLVREKKLQMITHAIQAANPDILVSTGDLVDGQIDDLSIMVETLRQIKPRLGKYAVTGNHEYYAGIDQAIRITRAAGFNVLSGNAVGVAGIIIAGVNDPAGQQMGLVPRIDETELISRHQPAHFTVLLKHRPSVHTMSRSLYDLQLSGHIHKGQIFPFGLVTHLFYPVTAGLSGMADGAWLYVSRGTGTWGPPIRFLAPPEITVIDLVHEEER